MRIVIEFYRTRTQDDAEALVGRETEEALDLAQAIVIAMSMARTLDMPQRPDALRITDVFGNELHSGPLHPDATEDAWPSQ